MSHDLRWRGSCGFTIWIPLLHFGQASKARDVTARVVGSGALLGRFFIEWLRNLQAITIGVFEHVLAGVPRSICNRLDDLRLASAMLDKSFVDAFDSEEYVGMQAGRLQLGCHLGIVSHVE